MNILFVCNQNQDRSRTAEELFPGARSAGLYNDKPVTEEALLWADVIFVMEEGQRKEIGNRFPAQYLKKRILSLDIPDKYHYRQRELVDVLNKRVPELLEPLLEL
jgi:predicted protein tyrosine phosphatase